MSKIQVEFFDDDTDEGQSASHEAEAEELALLFQIADKMTDGDLEKIRRLVEKKAEGAKNE